MKKINNVETIREEIKNGNVLLKFSASWCYPCKVVGETISSIENDFNNVSFIEVDIDEVDDDSILTEYKIKNIPALFFMKDGLISNKVIGSVNKNVIIENLNKLNNA
jgi:thioredoxin 1